jgi:hypothetical protein
VTSFNQMTRGVRFAAHVGAIAAILLVVGAGASNATEHSNVGRSGRTHPARYKTPSYYSDQANYFGNWGFAPGGYYWDPNYMWRRSRGFWDTNAPACPFRFC